MECVCKRNHTQKFAKVLQDIRSANYVILGREFNLYLHGLNENSYITYLTILL